MEVGRRTRRNEDCIFLCIFCMCKLWVFDRKNYTVLPIDSSGHAVAQLDEALRYKP